MNVLFHTITGSTLATVISSKKYPKHFKVKILFLGFLLGILSHGILDFIPHQYPISSKIDVFASVVFIASVLLSTKTPNRLIFAFCFLGTIFPDLIDLGPQIVNKLIGINLPTFKIFPWHRPQYSGSIFDGSHALLSNIIHLIVILLNLIVLLYFKHKNKVFNST